MLMQRIKGDRTAEMRSMKGVVELNIPAEKAWKMYRDNKIISTINHEMLALAKNIEGDGSPGSLRLFSLGPAVSGYVKESAHKIEKIEIGRSVTYLVVGGDLRNMYDPYRFTFSFLPVGAKQEEKCLAERKAEYEPLTSSTHPPDKARDAALAFLDSFDKFHHPAYY